MAEHQPTAIGADLRMQILALTHEHAWLLDHGGADRLHELYSENGSLIGLPPRDLIGRKAIEAWGAMRVKLTRVSRHVETNHRLFWRDGALCGTLYASVYRSDDGDTTKTTPFMVGDYEDEYAQEAGVWKISRRVIVRGFRVAH